MSLHLDQHPALGGLGGLSHLKWSNQENPFGFYFAWALPDSKGSEVDNQDWPSQG